LKRASEWSDGRFQKAGLPVPGWWNDDPILPGRGVELYRLSDAYYFPSTGAIVSSGGDAMEAAVEEMRSGVPESSLSRLAHTTVSGGTAYFRRPWYLPRKQSAIVTMPWGATFNYGHFVLDCLTGVIATSGVPELRGHPYVFPALTAWQRRHLALVGITEPQVLRRKVYRVAQVFYTSCMAHNLATPNVHFRALRELQLSNAKPGVPAGVGERIYVSRRRASQRSFIDEPQLEARLVALGFSVIEPEAFSVDEQIRIFHQARVVVGPTGAAFANVLYCQPGSVVVEIVPTPMAGQWVGWLCALNGAHWWPFYCEGRSGNNWAVQRDLVFSVDTDQLMERILAAIAH
jgi:capsular polysaccharide biosynthesis protein